mgnify:CR=1 FL=1
MTASFNAAAATNKTLASVIPLFSFTLPPLAQATAVGASLVSATLKVITAATEVAIPSLTLKSSVV